MAIDFTEAELRKFSPRMAFFYKDVLLSEYGKAVLAEAGILANGQRFAHFMGQFGGETAGGTILRESLNYTSVKRIKEVWPARSRKATEAELKALVRDPVALGDWAYGGRMGNRRGTSDGYDYRGGGFIQTTGRSAVQEYCKKAGIKIRPDILDDAEATLRFACIEWETSGCNLLADENDLLGISKTINTGSATSGVAPNGMEHRTAWFNKAKAIWWDHPEMKATEVAPPPTVAQNVKSTLQRSRTIFTTLSAFGGIVAYVYHEAIAIVLAAAAQYDALAPAAKVLSALGISVAGVALCIAFASLAGPILTRLDDARKGVNVK